MTKAARGEERGKVRLRFVEFELEGLSSTIEESIKSIVGSMNRASGGALPAAQRTSQTPQLTRLAPANGNDGSEQVGQEEFEGDSGSDESTGDRSSSTTPKAPKQYTQPKFLEAFDLDSGEKPFKSYVTEIGPETDNHRYLVIAAWAKQYRSLESSTIDHAYTCYQKMGWKSQKDVGQPFRKMKRSSLFQNPARGQWKITHIGLDRVRNGPGDSDSSQ
jgi:uncharacterized protein YjhX (UPF0386 family)